MAPQDTAAIAPTLQQLATKKIPVVTVDTRPDKGNVFMVVRADNRAYGEKACQFLGDEARRQGQGRRCSRAAWPRSTAATAPRRSTTA